MAKIDTSKWKEFKIGSIFDIHPTKAYKLTNSRLFEEDGVNPVVVNSSYNNGVGGYTNLSTTETGNIITFSDTTSADAIFYQENDFVGYPHVQGLYPHSEYKEKWTKYSLLFFLTEMKKAAFSLGFDYVFKFTREIAKEIAVKLPVLSDGTPDYDYMERFMKEIESKALDHLDNLNYVCKKKKTVIDLSHWREFSISELFDVVKGSRLTKADMREGTIRYVGASSFNNGITTYISNTEHLHPANTLTVCYNGSDIGRTFYQSETYWATDDVNVLYPKFEMNENLAMFFAPIIKCVGGLHEYDDKWKLEDMKREIIKLPVKADGTPDFFYMESFIQKTRNVATERVAILQSL